MAGLGSGGSAPGHYMVAASEGARAAPPVPTAVTEENPGGRLTLELAPGARCAGLVLDDTGTSLAGRLVRLERASLSLGEDPLPGLAETGADGRFQAAALPPGRLSRERRSVGLSAADHADRHRWPPTARPAS